MDWNEIKLDETWGGYFKHGNFKHDTHREISFFQVIHELVMPINHREIVNENEKSKSLWKWAGCINVER